MKTILSKLTFLVVFIGYANIVSAQMPTNRLVPDSISISKTAFDNLFNYKENDTIRKCSNAYLNDAVVLLNRKFEENRQLKLKLDYFTKSYLIVQVNGDDSILIFIISDDKSIFYKNNIYANKFVLVKCSEDDIISE